MSMSAFEKVLQSRGKVLQSPGFVDELLAELVFALESLPADVDIDPVRQVLEGLLRDVRYFKGRFEEETKLA